MAGLSKEERARRQAEKEEQLRKEIEEKVRSEIVSSENDSNSNKLKEENETLKVQISEMMKMIKELQNSNVSPSGENISNNQTQINKDVEMNARILVTSMTTGGVNLKTSTDGTARHFRFEKLGQTIPIIYEHLINCINTDRWLFEEGLIRNFLNLGIIESRNYIRISYGSFLYAGTNGISPFS